MIISLKNKTSLLEYCLNIINSVFKDGEEVKAKNLAKSVDFSLDKIEYCHKGIKDFKKYTTKNKQIYFDHLNTDHFCTFLYFLSNSTYANCSSKTICTKIYYLNKVMHGVDILYSVKLPKIFNLQHPVGSVLGPATYKNYLTVYNNCTVGRNSSNSKYEPYLEKNVTLRPNASVIGNSFIGENSEISIGSTVYNQKIRKNSIYFGDPIQHHILKKFK